MKQSRSPLGLRGLKFAGTSVLNYGVVSQPTRAAWIEMSFPALFQQSLSKSQPTRAAWIEIMLALFFSPFRKVSQPTRAAWIEIFKIIYLLQTLLVAAHSGCVD